MLIVITPSSASVESATATATAFSLSASNWIALAPATVFTCVANSLGVGRT